LNQALPVLTTELGEAHPETIRARAVAQTQSTPPSSL
jgi:hypothetical protein